MVLLFTKIPVMKINPFRVCSQTRFKRRGRWVVQKCPLFVNVHTIANVNAGGYVVKKSQNLVNVVCERPIIELFILI